MPLWDSCLLPFIFENFENLDEQMGDVRLFKADSLLHVADSVSVIYLSSPCFSVCADENMIHVSGIAVTPVLSLTCCMSAL